MFRQTNGTTIGLGSADLAIEFDPSVFQVTGVRLGNVPVGFTLTESFDNATGAVSPRSVRPRARSGCIRHGRILAADRPDDPTGSQPGRGAAQPAGRGASGDTVLYTSLNDGNLTLVPAPTDSDLDPTNGSSMSPRRPPRRPRPPFLRNRGPGEHGWDPSVAPVRSATAMATRLQPPFHLHWKAVL